MHVLAQQVTLAPTVRPRHVAVRRVLMVEPVLIAEAVLSAHAQLVTRVPSVK